VITGFNTDVEHGGVIYHVQTEDKGLDSPIILSLVYSGGAILASKRAPYEDLLASGFSEAVLAERLKRQHRLICAAIHAGRIDDLKHMSTAPIRGSSAAQAEDETLEAPAAPLDMLEFHIQPPQKTPLPPPETLDFQIETPLQALEAQAQNPPPVETPKAKPQPPPPPAPPPPPEFGMETIYEPAPRKNPFAEFGNETIYEPAPSRNVQESIGNQTIYEPAPPPPRPPEPIGNQTIYEPAPVVSSEPPVVQDNRRESPLGEIPSSDQGLIVSLLDEQEFRSGDTANVRIMVTQRSGEFEKPVNNVAISLKILGTTFRPQMHAAKTQKNGLATITVQIPNFTSGRAAILVRASAGSQATEIRRVVHPGR
jgi:hypothetical protein